MLKEKRRDEKRWEDGGAGVFFVCS